MKSSEFARVIEIFKLFKLFYTTNLYFYFFQFPPFYSHLNLFCSYLHNSLRQGLLKFRLFCTSSPWFETWKMTQENAIVCNKAWNGYLFGSCCALSFHVLMISSIIWEHTSTRTFPENCAGRAWKSSIDTVWLVECNKQWLIDTGSHSLAVFCPQFKFDGNFALP